MTDEFRTERARLMAESNRLRAEARTLKAAGRIENAMDLLDQVSEIADRYQEMLPEVTVARDPDGGELVRWPIDTAGLDGRFWEYQSAAREDPDDLPADWIAMAGAMRLSPPVEHFPHLAVPGPGVPFVVARILEAPDVRAVIAEVPVGRHTGWAITYFGPPPPDVSLVNQWGADTYPVYEDGEWTGWDRVPETGEGYDFDLAPWLRAGKLLWIEPGDDEATLREGTGGCPYLDLPGERRIQFVEKGEVRH